MDGFARQKLKTAPVTPSNLKSPVHELAAPKTENRGPTRRPNPDFRSLFVSDQWPAAAGRQRASGLRQISGTCSQAEQT